MRHSWFIEPQSVSLTSAYYSFGAESQVLGHYYYYCIHLRRTTNQLATTCFIYLLGPRGKVAIGWEMNLTTCLSVSNTLRQRK